MRKAPAAVAANNGCQHTPQHATCWCGNHPTCVEHKASKF